MDEPEITFNEPAHLIVPAEDFRLHGLKYQTQPIRTCYYIIEFSLDGL